MKQDGTFAAEADYAARVARDPQAFLALYDLYFARMYNYVRYRTPEAETADDLVSLVFETAFEKIRDYNPARGPFGAWLFGISRNLVNYDLRVRRRQGWAPLEAAGERADGSPSPEDQVIRDEIQQGLLEAVYQLDERERDLLGLKFGGRLTNRRISELTGLSESNVGVIVFRAVQKLRMALGPDFE